MIFPALFFYLFAGVCIAAAVMVIAARNPVHSVLFLILAFVNAAALFILLGAEFLAMILIIVYVGAVLVLFLFVVMMLDVDFAQLRQGFMQYLPIGAFLGGILLIELVLVLVSWTIGPDAQRTIATPIPPIASMFNAEALGHVLYTRYVYFFQAAGVVLLVAMIGAIVLTLRHKPHVKRQNIADQIARTKATSSRSGRARDFRELQGNDMTIGLGHYLTVAAILFTIGIFGIFLNRKNVIIILMSIELILLAVNVNLVAFSAFLGDLVGQVYALLVLTVAAAEAAIGLAILVAYYRNRGSIAVEDINLMKG
jgi:NADH-quinone oxidoreductase subunit J